MTEENIGLNLSPTDSLTKRYTLFSRIALFATGIGLFHTIEDFLYGGDYAPLIDLFIAIFMFGCYLLSRFNHHNSARFLGLSFLNVVFTIYACLVPKEVGVYLFFFPLISISSAVFDSSEKFYRIFFVALSVTLLASLFISDFDLIGSYQIDAPHVDTFFIINIFSSSLVIIVCTNFVIRVNEDSEKKLRVLAQEIEIKNTNLQKTNSELDRFIYSTTHDLRAPLLSIKGLVNIASLETKEDSMRNYLSMMNERADKLDGFIKDIIDYSRNKRTEVKIELINLNELVEGVIDNYKFLEGSQKIRFDQDIVITKLMKMDKSRISTVLNNLISNAIKYHNLNLLDPWIKVSATISNDVLCISIADNGQGINIEHHQKIFDMFYRGTDKSKGSGLGLYIVKEMIDKMNGSIQVESKIDEGSTFYITIPISSNGIA